MKILTFDTEEQINEAGAAIIASVVQTKAAAVLGLATGGTPVGIYKQLVQTYERGLISFKDVTTFNLDEYVGIGPDHHQSYNYYMKENLFNHVDIDAARTNIPRGLANDLDIECRRYEQMIDDAGSIDIQLLGLGHNGHIGFNEPAADLSSSTHVVKLAEATKAANARFFTAEEEMPSLAITMGVGTILKAKMLLLVVKGEDKAEIVKQALTGPITTDCPASMLQTHSNLVVLLDNAAGSLL
ncbi:MAG: glucosamine-6-phosphate deaminase [Candidatus Pristimantibacillus lignocellulolyticus]|uniref:Glucosamine-6-phosphate deaminase n=1 Tax=Candidatus Pristimantibacillus lignocellulolyticus TaxID=2994561 RepID=A0A9J6Z8Y1_9BACL|nr:MAG: glucosamine-6-phosphate deaminase [Candidatus Pristimantibacillus lignocellulolyticus]